MNRVIEIDVVSLQEGMNLNPGSETEHSAQLPFRQAFAAVSLQRQGFKGGAREVWLLVLYHARDVVRDLELHVHTGLLSHCAGTESSETEMTLMEACRSDLVSSCFVVRIISACRGALSRRPLSRRPQLGDGGEVYVKYSG